MVPEVKNPRIICKIRGCRSAERPRGSHLLVLRLGMPVRLRRMRGKKLVSAAMRAHGVGSAYQNDLYSLIKALISITQIFIKLSVHCLCHMKVHGSKLTFLFLVTVILNTILFYFHGHSRQVTQH